MEDEEPRPNSICLYYPKCNNHATLFDLCDKHRCSVDGCPRKTGIHFPGGTCTHHDRAPRVLPEIIAPVKLSFADNVRNFNKLVNAIMMSTMIDKDDASRLVVIYSRVTENGSRVLTVPVPEAVANLERTIRRPVTRLNFSFADVHRVSTALQVNREMAFELLRRNDGDAQVLLDRAGRRNVIERPRSVRIGNLSDPSTHIPEPPLNRNNFN